MTKTQIINWKPFSDKHKNYINDSLKNKMCVAEGSIRSGKTIDHCIIAAVYLEKCKDKIHLASGSTMPNAKLNIGACNGFGLENLFRGRCRWGKYKENHALFIQTSTGEKIVIFSGGGKADSYKRILGNSYGLWIATEINEHYDSNDSRESFIKVAFGRQAAAEEPFTLWDLNPCHPKHKIYTDYIDKYKKAFLGGYLYEHFTLMDNLSITEQRRAEIESQYDVNSIWYKRDILGQRCVAEGLIYKLFANNPQKYYKPLEEIKGNSKKKMSGISLMEVNIGLDFGGSSSCHAIVATGITPNYESLIVLRSERIEAEGTKPTDVDKFASDFVSGILKDFGRCDYLYWDNAEQVLGNGVEYAVGLSSPCVSVRECYKDNIIERIRTTERLISSNRFFYTDGCETVVDAMCDAMWDSKKIKYERLDDGTTDIDTLDAKEYSFTRRMDNFISG